MAYGGFLNGPGPQGYAFMPTGPSQQVALAASSVTVTLAQFVGTAPYATQCGFWNLGGVANVNSAAFVAFGSTSTTVSATTGVPIVPAALISVMANRDDGFQILTTGKRPQNVCVIGSTGTTTVYITPGEGSR